MALKQKALNYVIIPIVALAFSIPVFLLFPPEVTRKFNITASEYKIRTDGSHRHYFDLDNDGKSEQVISGINNPQSV